MLKAVTIDGTDVTDKTMDFAAGQRLTDVQIIVSSRSAGVSGTVVRQDDALVTHGSVIVFADAPERRAYPSRFVKMAPIDEAGRFSVAGVPAGRYLVAAMDVLDPAWNAPETLEQLRDRATAVVLVEERQTTVRLILPTKG
jgi:hypothetical protein